ncbi:hypothetical protein [Caballeronia sp. LjRoot29]|uniref:hypothetical protein n=1 Tax=Caballeronia sp. LjRoot29 TaxID=3342315 RepID=UPI003F4F64F2
MLFSSRICIHHSHTIRRSLSFVPDTAHFRASLSNQDGAHGAILLSATWRLSLADLNTVQET